MNEHDHNDHHQSPDLTIDLNVNVRLPGILPFLSSFLHNQGIIMADLQALEAKVDELVASNTALSAKVEESNGKTDALIVVAGDTKAALVALQGQVSPDLQPLIDKLQRAIDTNVATTSSISAQENETDGAAGADAP